MELIGSYGPHSSPQRLQPRKRLRQPFGPIHIRGAYRRRQRERGGSRGTNQKLASRRLIKVILNWFVHGRKKVYLAAALIVKEDKSLHLKEG